jgi:hypothetical protein
MLSFESLFLLSADIMCKERIGGRKKVYANLDTPGSEGDCPAID